MNAIANHLWQSTLFAIAAGLLTLALRWNRARVRHGVWLVASCKFLLPFSVLIALGSHIPWRTASPQNQPSVSFVMDEVTQPFSTPLAIPTLPKSSSLPAVLSGIWLAGFLGIAGSWVIRWRRLEATVRGGSPVEPGVFGIFKPVLLLPEGIAARLTPAQLNAVIEHELCHIRHRDNLSAAIQMFIETVFWFHPLVWWIGKRMVEERERACDEEVLANGSEPRAYADAILHVCKLYVKSPLVCVSGVAGANLKQRIEAIMSNRTPVKLNAVGKLLLAGAGLLAVAVPVAIGLLNAPPIQAQAPSANTSAFDVASVKAVATTDPPGYAFPTALPGVRFVSKFPLYSVIAYAYNLPFNRSPRLSGIPDAIGGSIYVIEAKGTFPAGLSSQARDDRMRSMVQTLLADRFKLTIHRETREMPVYALVVGKGGPKLQRADIEEKDCPDESANVPGSRPLPGPATPMPDVCHQFNGGQGRGLHARAVTMSDLATEVENWAGRPLLDKTGIKGLYRIQTRGWLPVQATQAPTAGAKAEDGSELSDLPTLFQIFEQLGLKMEAQKGQAEVYVVDHVESPSAN